MNKKQTIININKIYPTQQNLNTTKIIYYNNLDLKYQKINLPEVFMINNKHYLLDGHHKTYSFYLKGLNEIPVISHNKKNTSKNFYKIILNEINEKLNKLNKNITHILDLELL